MDSKVEFLFLNEEDMIKAGVLDADRAVDTVGEVITLLSEGDYLMGGRAHNDHGVQLIFPEKSDIPNFPLADSADRRFMAMPAYLGGRFHMCGEKWYGSNGRNSHKGLPRSILMATLNDVETGQPLAYMSANLLSAMRTGAMPGLTAMYLARKDSKVLTILGSGVIGRTSLMAIMAKFPDIEVLKIKGSSKTSHTAHELADFARGNYRDLKEIIICDTLEEAVRDTDIITEAVSCKEGEWPEYKREWLKPGALVISTSTFNMEHKSIVDLKKVIDNYGMYENYAEEDNVGYDENGNRLHTGCMGEDFVYMVQDGLIERDSLTTFGEIIRGKKPGRESDDEIILVSIEGMPTEDVAWAYECYTYALVHDIGTKLKVWDRPYAF